MNNVKKHIETVALLMTSTSKGYYKNIARLLHARDVVYDDKLTQFRKMCVTDYANCKIMHAMTKLLATDNGVFTYHLHYYVSA